MLGKVSNLGSAPGSLDTIHGRWAGHAVEAHCLFSTSAGIPIVMFRTIPNGPLGGENGQGAVLTIQRLNANSVRLRLFHPASSDHDNQLANTTTGCGNDFSWMPSKIHQDAMGTKIAAHVITATPATGDHSGWSAGATKGDGTTLTGGRG